MGEEDFACVNTSIRSCSYCSQKMDCDGDWCNWCYAPSDHNCGYKNHVRDCDGDIITLCSK